VNSEKFLARFRRHPDYKDQMVHVQDIPAREARYGNLEPPLTPRLREALEQVGVRNLYAHQTEAIDLARSGFHLIITTPTASGKSLCYNAPILETLLTDPNARALYLFPTKALAQDQRGKIEALKLHPDISTATYDGDTPKEERTWIKRYARLVITNPDMLHIGILPYHASWMNFIRNLRYIVVDEAHIYRGVFGAHVANILPIRTNFLVGSPASMPKLLPAMVLRRDVSSSFSGTRPFTIRRQGPGSPRTAKRRRFLRRWSGKGYGR
jgi:DEAD/DEAH box helicase domain-containing protein